VSQSAVSRRLAQLESELGLSLFVSDKGRLIPAREAQMLDSQIGLLLDHGARLKVRAREMREGSAATDTLRIAFPGSMTLSILPDILEKFLADQPRVQVEVHTGAYDTIERMLWTSGPRSAFCGSRRSEPGWRPFRSSPCRRSASWRATILWLRAMWYPCRILRGSP